MQAVLLVGLGFFRELMGHEVVMQPLHTVNHGGFGPKVIEQTSEEVNKYLKWTQGCLCYKRSEYTTGVIHAGLQTICAWATIHMQIVQWPRIVSNRQVALSVNSTGRLHPNVTGLHFQAEAEMQLHPIHLLENCWVWANDQSCMLLQFPSCAIYSSTAWKSQHEALEEQWEMWHCWWCSFREIKCEV